jgi:hypothetical protein
MSDLLTTLFGAFLLCFALLGGWAIFNDPLAGEDWSHDHPKDGYR